MEQDKAEAHRLQRCNPFRLDSLSVAVVVCFPPHLGLTVADGYYPTLRLLVDAARMDSQSCTTPLLPLPPFASPPRTCEGLSEGLVAHPPVYIVLRPSLPYRPEPVPSF